MTSIRERIDESSSIISGLIRQEEKISAAVEAITESLKKGGKLIVFGNGGSAAQAQHIVAELVVRFKMNRAPLRAIALTTDTSILTAAANDYGFPCIFSRQLEALAGTDDVALALSTSGDSPNVLRAIETAKDLKLTTIALLGKGGGKAQGAADIELVVNSQATDRIQEAHLLILHMIAETIESVFFQE